MTSIRTKIIRRVGQSAVRRWRSNSSNRQLHTKFNILRQRPAREKFKNLINQLEQRVIHPQDFAIQMMRLQRDDLVDLARQKGLRVASFDLKPYFAGSVCDGVLSDQAYQVILVSGDLLAAKLNLTYESDLFEQALNFVGVDPKQVVAALKAEYNFLPEILLDPELLLMSGLFYDPAQLMGLVLQAQESSLEEYYQCNLKDNRPLWLTTHNPHSKIDGEADVHPFGIAAHDIGHWYTNLTLKKVFRDAISFALQKGFKPVLCDQSLTIPKYLKAFEEVLLEAYGYNGKSGRCYDVDLTKLSDSNYYEQAVENLYKVITRVIFDPSPLRTEGIKNYSRLIINMLIEHNQQAQESEQLRNKWVIDAFIKIFDLEEE